MHLNMHLNMHLRTESKPGAGLAGREQPGLEHQTQLRNIPGGVGPAEKLQAVSQCRMDVSSTLHLVWAKNPTAWLYSSLSVQTGKSTWETLFWVKLVELQC